MNRADLNRQICEALAIPGWQKADRIQIVLTPTAYPKVVVTSTITRADLSAFQFDEVREFVCTPIDGAHVEPADPAKG